ncbi:MAG: hypothetical protein RTU92_15020 [Candidatus Thorarchaeota archaeon]
MTSGDGWFFQIYRDVPQSISTKFTLYAIMIVMGIIALVIGGY